MNTIGRVICLIAVLFCLGVSSSVVARTYTYTFGGEFTHELNLEPPPSPFSMGDSFDGYVEYELIYPRSDGENTGPFSLVHFSVSINGGEPITLDNFEPDVTSDQYDNYAYSAAIEATVHADGSFSGGILKDMYLSFNSSTSWKDDPGIFNLGFGGSVHGYDYIGGRITRGTIIGFPASPPDLYTFSGVLDDADGTYPEGFAPSAEFFGVVEFTSEYLLCESIFGDSWVHYATVQSLSVMIDGRLIGLDNFTSTNVNDCGLVAAGPDTVLLGFFGTGEFEEFVLGSINIELNKNAVSMFKVQFGSRLDFVSGPITGGTILNYSFYEVDNIFSDGFEE